MDKEGIFGWKVTKETKSRSSDRKYCKGGRMDVSKENLEKIEDALYTAWDRLDMIDPDGTNKDWDDSELCWFGPAVEKEEVWAALTLIRSLKEDV